MSAVTGTAHFGYLKDGRSIEEVTLSNESVECKVLTYGARIRSLILKLPNEEHRDVFSGYDELSSYEADEAYLGAVTGRLIGRIEGASYERDGKRTTLSANKENCHFHGGFSGLDKQVFSVESASDSTVVLVHHSAAGLEGYPGNLSLRVSYSLCGKQLIQEIDGTVDEVTPINIAVHFYCNLNGHNSGNVYDHSATVNADRSLEYKPGKTFFSGNIIPTSGKLWDLSKTEHCLGTNIRNFAVDGGVCGYDHSYVISSDAPRDEEDGTALAASFRAGDVALDVFTNQNICHVYTANYYANLAGKGGSLYNQHGAICIECENYINSMNFDAFPSCFVSPNEKYESIVKYSFKF